MVTNFIILVMSRALSLRNPVRRVDEVRLTNVFNIRTKFLFISTLISCILAAFLVPEIVSLCTHFCLSEYMRARGSSLRKWRSCSESGILTILSVFELKATSLSTSKNLNRGIASPYKPRMVHTKQHSSNFFMETYMQSFMSSKSSSKVNGIHLAYPKSCG